MRRDPISDGISRDLALVRAKEHNFFAVRRPEVIAADPQLLGIYPVNVAVQQIVIAVLGELLLRFAVRRTNVQIVLAEIGNAVSIRRELRIPARIAGGGELYPCLARQVIHPELSLRIEDEVF